MTFEGIIMFIYYTDHFSFSFFFHFFPFFRSFFLLTFSSFFTNLCIFMRINVGRYVNEAINCQRKSQSLRTNNKWYRNIWEIFLFLSYFSFRKQTRNRYDRKIQDNEALTERTTEERLRTMRNIANTSYYRSVDR